MRLWPGNNFTFLFSLQTISGLDKQRERERERKKRELPIHLIAPQHRRSHISRTTTEIASPSKTDPPRSIAPHQRPIHRRSHHPRPIAPHWDRITPDRSTQNRSHWRRRHPWPISSPSHCYPSPSRHLLVITHHPDRSLPFPPFLITLSSSLSQFDRTVEFNEWCCFDFCFFKFIDWNFLL